MKTTKNYLRDLDTYDRRTRSGDFKDGKKVGYTEKFYPPLPTMSTFEDLLSEIRRLNKNE